MVFCAKVYTLYTERTHSQYKKNDHATRKSPGQIALVRVLGFILCKEGTTSLYKNKLATGRQVHAVKPLGCLTANFTPQGCQLNTSYLVTVTVRCLFRSDKR
jgi:hypothetical protein